MDHLNLGNLEMGAAKKATASDKKIRTAMLKGLGSSGIEVNSEQRRLIGELAVQLAAM